MRRSMILIRPILLFSAFAVSAFGGYQYDFTMNTATPGANWASNGTVTTGSGGVSFASQGSLILAHTQGVPVANSTTDSPQPGTSSSDYEVASTLQIQTAT